MLSTASPDVLINTVVGTPRKPYTLRPDIVASFNSTVWSPKSSGFFALKASIVLVFSPKFTRYTVACPLSFWPSSSRSGNSLMQGAHQVAQKLTTAGPWIVDG